MTSAYDLTSIPVMYASYAWPEINRRDRGTSNANWPNGSVAPFENAVEGQSFPPFWILLSLSSAYAQKLTAECSERKFLCTFQFMCEFTKSTLLSNDSMDGTKWESHVTHLRTTSPSNLQESNVLDIWFLVQRKRFVERHLDQIPSFTLECYGLDDTQGLCTLCTV